MSKNAHYTQQKGNLSSVDFRNVKTLYRFAGFIACGGLNDS